MRGFRTMEELALTAVVVLLLLFTPMLDPAISFVVAVGLLGLLVLVFSQGQRRGGYHR